MTATDRDEHVSAGERLDAHLRSLVQHGAIIEMRHERRAIIVRPARRELLRTTAIALAALVGYALSREPLLLAAVAVAVIGGHRKLAAGVERVRSIVRIDEHGRIAETVIEQI